MENMENILGKAIGNSVGYFPTEVVNMLKRNDIPLSSSSLSNSQLIDLVIYGLQNSKSFRNEFDVFVKNNENVLLNDYLGIDSAWITGGAGIITGALGLIGGKQQQDAIRAQANAQAQTAQAQLQIAQINQQTKLAELEALKNQGVPAKSNTALYIGLGVGGVVILGLVVFLAVKK
jgi:hypothetical protein